MNHRQNTPAPGGQHAPRPTGEPAKWHPCEPTDAQLDALLAQALKHSSPPRPEPLSDHELADVMARLQARGVVDDPQALSETPKRLFAQHWHKAAEARAGAWRGALAWLRLQPANGVGLRWVVPGAAALGLAAVLVPQVLPPPDAGMDIAKDGAGAELMRTMPASAPRIVSAQPAADAKRLAAELLEAGATVQVQSDGPDRLVHAAVPDAATPAVGQVLLAWGLAPNVPPQLEVRLMRIPD